MKSLGGPTLKENFFLPLGLVSKLGTTILRLLFIKIAGCSIGAEITVSVNGGFLFQCSIKSTSGCLYIVNLALLYRTRSRSTLLFVQKFLCL